MRMEPLTTRSLRYVSRRVVRSCAGLNSNSSGVSSINVVVHMLSAKSGWVTTCSCVGVKDASKCIGVRREGGVDVQ